MGQSGACLEVAEKCVEKWDGAAILCLLEAAAVSHGPLRVLCSCCSRHRRTTLGRETKGSEHGELLLKLEN